MAREKLEPNVCPVCSIFLGDVTASAMKANGTMEEHYTCTDTINCSSQWTAVYRFLALRDVEDNRLPDPWEVPED